ncbi:MAG: hypothetical protein Tsb0033_01300 [Winogradskyella sp.]
MKLTKEDIQIIDDYLKERGIKYWDVRLEMVDHLVSDIENHKGSADFDTAFKQSLVNAGWNKNLEAINTQSWKSTNKIYRKKHFEEIVKLLKKPYSLISFISFYILINRVAVVFPEALKILAFVVIGSPILMMIYEFIKSWRKKLGKSVNMQYGVFYFSFGVIMINLPLQFLPKTQMGVWLPLVLTIYLLMMLAGYKVYKYAYNKVVNLKVIS